MAIEQAPIDTHLKTVFEKMLSVDPRYLRKDHSRRCKAVLPPPVCSYGTLSFRLTPVTETGDGIWFIQLQLDLSKIVRVVAGRETTVVAVASGQGEKRRVNVFDELDDLEKNHLMATALMVRCSWETRQSGYAPKPHQPLPV